jgi:hypothetical protein
VDTGQWDNSANPDALNLTAATLGGSDPVLAHIGLLPGFPGFYPTAMTTLRLAPAFMPFTPRAYLRPLDGQAASQ